jgi:Predicted membrane protein (DUF2142)
VLSVSIGLFTIAINPPLRGTDEPAHFLRAFGIAQGELIARTADASGRRGLFLPAGLYDQFRQFNEIRGEVPGGGYADIFARYFDERRAVIEAAPVFVPYEGSEGYSPVAYLPYAAAAILAKGLGLGFLGMLYLMRLAGLLAAALMAAYAFARMLWLAISSLTEPPQVAFVVLELMRAPIKSSRNHWFVTALVVVPSLVLALSWVLAASADVGAWRVSDGLPSEEFDPLWKIRFLLQHPVRFAAMALTSLDYSAELWRQMIGVFGWLDVRMQSWSYPAISFLLALTFVARIDFEPAARRRIALVSAVTILGYCLAVFVIFFVAFTPTSAERILGLQGRYFIVIVPLLALIASAIIDRDLGRVAAAAAMAGSLVSAAAMLEALWRVHWGA